MALLVARIILLVNSYTGSYGNCRKKFHVLLNFTDIFLENFEFKLSYKIGLHVYI